MGERKGEKGGLERLQGTRPVFHADGEVAMAECTRAQESCVAMARRHERVGREEIRETVVFLRLNEEKKK